MKHYITVPDEGICGAVLLFPVSEAEIDQVSAEMRTRRRLKSVARIIAARKEEHRVERILHDELLPAHIVQVTPAVESESRVGLYRENGPGIYHPLVIRSLIERYLDDWRQRGWEDGAIMVRLLGDAEYRLRQDSIATDGVLPPRSDAAHADVIRAVLIHAVHVALEHTCDDPNPDSDDLPVSCQEDIVFSIVAQLTLCLIGAIARLKAANGDAP